MNRPTLKARTAHGLLWSGVSGGVMQLLNLIFGVCLARLLTPHDYGMVGVLSIFSLLAASLQESGFTAALANRAEVSHADYNAVFWLSTGVSGVLYLLLYAAAPAIATFYAEPQLIPLARYTFLGFFIASLGIAHNAYLFRHLMVKQKSLSTLTALLVSGVVGVTMAYKGFAYWGIATQSIVYVTVINLCYRHFVPWHPTWQIRMAPIRGMFTFSSKLLITNLCTHIHNQLLSVVLGRCYSQQQVGYYTQGAKWNAMGHGLLTTMVSSVAQPVLAGVATDGERQRRVFRKMLRFTSFVSFPAMFGLCLVAPAFITVAITEKWLPAAALMQWLCVGGAFIPLQQLCAQLVVSKGKSDIYMWNTLALALVQTIAMVLLHTHGIALMVKVYVGIGVLGTALWWWFAHRTVGITLWELLHDVAPFAAIAAAVMVATHYATLGIGSVVWLLVVRIVLAALLYVGIMWAAGSVTLQESYQYLLHRTTHE